MDFKKRVYDKRSYVSICFFWFPFSCEFLGTAGFPGDIEFGHGFSQPSFFSRYLKLFFCPSCHLLAGPTSDKNLYQDSSTLSVCYYDVAIRSVQLIFLWYDSHQEAWSTASQLQSQTLSANKTSDDNISRCGIHHKAKLDLQGSHFFYPAKFPDFSLIS